MTPSGFHHVAIQVRDLAAAERFYSGALGLPILRRWFHEDGSPRSVWVKVGEGFIALEACAGEPDPGPFRDGRAGIHLAALRIERGDRAAWEARFGAAIVHRTKYTLYVRDPEGNRIGLSHYPAGA